MKDVVTIIRNLAFGFFMAFALPAVLFYVIKVDKKKFPNKLEALSGIGLITVATVILGYLVHVFVGLPKANANWAVYLSICIAIAMSNNLTDEDLFSYADKKE